MMSGPFVYKAFQSGFSLEQSYQPTTDTFTDFYLKGVGWADPELYHLGPVVAAQQIHRWPLD